MATVKKGVLVRAGEWWTHLRKTKRSFWKRHRAAERYEVSQELRDRFADLRRREPQEGD